MTVKELRKKLRGLPEDAEVVVRVLDSDLETHVVSCDFDTERKRDFIMSVKIILGLMAIMAAGIGCGYLAFKICM
jgi:hypothetical protein